MQGCKEESDLDVLRNGQYLIVMTGIYGVLEYPAVSDDGYISD